MTFRIEILADDASELAVKLAGVAQIFLPGMRFVPVEAAEAPAPTDPDGKPVLDEAPAEQPAEKPKQTRKAAPKKVKDETPPAAEAKPEDKKDDEPKPLTAEEVKAKAIAYANAVAEKDAANPDARKSAFKALLDYFKIAKYGELPADKVGDMNALIDTKMAELG